jgi:mitochondrial fission protein ELM1
MNILWIKDGKKGHEKQVQALLEELSKTIDIKIYQEDYHISPLKRFFDIFHHSTSYVFKKYDSCEIIKSYNQNDIHLVIGAGSNIHTRLLLLKKFLKDIYNKDIIAISVLTPSLFKNEFNFICAPNHDEIKLSNIKNTIFFEGSLAKVSIQEPDDSIGLIGLGGINNHFIFNEDDLIKQIEYILSLYPNKDWYLFSSRRTSDLMIDKIKTLTNSFSNLIVAHDNFDEIIKRASIKFITQDSMNMVYESLSTKGQTFVFNMKYKNENKITKQIKKLIENKQIGYIENIAMSDGLKKIKIQPQNPHFEVFAEVEKLSFQLAGKLKTLK